MNRPNLSAAKLGLAFMVAIFLMGTFMILQTALAEDVSTTVIVANATPTVTNVKILNDNPIVLTSNATTAITVSFIVTDSNDCTDVFELGTVSTTLLRGGVAVYTNDDVDCTASNLDCYRVSTSSHSCTSGTSADATATLEIYYFADATDGSSSYSAQAWQAFVIVQDQAVASGSASSSDQELNSLTSLTSQSSTIDYGTVAANADTGATNQQQPFANTGNTTSGLTVYGTALLNAAANEIATGQQKYATSSFTYGTDDIALTETAVSVSDTTSTNPTSTEYVLTNLYWGIAILNGQATGTYAGTSTFGVNYGP